LLKIHSQNSSKKLPLTLACGQYEITRPLIEGIVKPEGIDLTVVSEMDSTTRQWRFLRNREFDVSETSSGNHIVSVGQGGPFTALPVFLHRRFRHGFIFINTGKGIKTPKDLVGKRIGVKTFMVTAIAWSRGILEEEYGVRREDVEWVVELDEDVAFDPPKNLKLTRLPPDSPSVETLLANGEVDAVMHPDLIQPLLDKDPRVGRLFPDYKTEELAYYAKTKIFPIMHVMGLRHELVEAHPWVPMSLFNAFNEAKAIAMRRMANPLVAPLAWYEEQWEEQQNILGPDPWEYGLTAANRHNFGKLVEYAHKDGVIAQALPVDDFFTSVTDGVVQDKKRA
jgi:4,5-dihydroxyphthalate decarboxylase